MPSLISANRLTDGKIVYLGRDGGWTEDFPLAHVFPGKPEMEAALEIAKQAVSENLIVDPAAVSLKPDLSNPSPISLRDAIRVMGPTIQFGPKTEQQPVNLASPYPLFRSHYVSLR